MRVLFTCTFQSERDDHFIASSQGEFCYLTSSDCSTNIGPSHYKRYVRQKQNNTNNLCAPWNHYTNYADKKNELSTKNVPSLFFLVFGKKFGSAALRGTFPLEPGLTKRKQKKAKTKHELNLLKK